MNIAEVFDAVCKATDTKPLALLYGDSIEHSISRGVFYVVCESLGVKNADKLMNKYINENHMEQYRTIVSESHKQALIDAYGILNVLPPIDNDDFIVYSGKDYIKVTTKNDVYEAIDASTVTFGNSAVGMKNGNIYTDGDDIDSVIKKMIHMDLCECINNMSIKQIKEAWKNI